MLFSRTISTVTWALSLTLAAASPADLGLVPAYRVRNAPGMSDLDTIRAIRRSLARSVGSNETLLNSTTGFSKAWTDAVLYKHDFSTAKETANSKLTANASVSISCKECYATANLTTIVAFEGDFDVTQAFKNVTSQIKTEAKNITHEALDVVEEVLSDIGDLVVDLFDGGGVDLDHIQFPTVDVDFGIDIPEIPGISLQFIFTNMELYIELEATLSAQATYELNLYTSKTEAGIKINDDLLLGVVVIVDLIIDAHAEIDISSGFHLKIEDGLSLDIEMFSKNVSNINFPGAKFEFLPVTISTDGAVLSATLRVGVHAGVAIEAISPFITASGDISLGAGIEVSAFANIATFVTNVTANPISIGARKDHDNCDLSVVEYYEFAIGAAAGASINVGTKTWGNTPNTTTAIFYTTLAEACATFSSAPTTTTASTTSAPKMARQQALTTKTITTTEVFSGQVCASPGLVNCPASLQQTTTFPTVRTLVTAVPSGVTPTFPPTTFNGVSSTKDFGAGVKEVSSSSGAPTAYTPPPDPTSTEFIPQATAAIGDAVKAAENWLDGSTGGVSNKIILGVSVGVGVPVLIGLISLVCCLCRRRRYDPVPNPKQGGGVTNIYLTNGPEPYDPHKGSNVRVSVSGR